MMRFVENAMNKFIDSKLFLFKCMSLIKNEFLNMKIRGFDYRPFVLNWCMSLRSIDGYAVDDLERLINSYF